MRGPLGVRYASAPLAAYTTGRGLGWISSSDSSLQESGMTSESSPGVSAMYCDNEGMARYLTRLSISRREKDSRVCAAEKAVMSAFAT